MTWQRRSCRNRQEDKLKDSGWGWVTLLEIRGPSSEKDVSERNNVVIRGCCWNEVLSVASILTSLLHAAGRPTFNSIITRVCRLQLEAMYVLSECSALQVEELRKKQAGQGEVWAIR